MELWKTKEKHKVGKKREDHTVKICIPSSTVENVLRAISNLQENHDVPQSAYIIILAGGWNTWVKAHWVKDV